MRTSGKKDGENVNALIALAPVATWGFGDIIIAIIIVAAVLGVMYIALQQFGVAIPVWLVRIIVICIVAVVAICAVRFLLSL